MVFVNHIETTPHNNELNKIKKPQQLFTFQQVSVNSMDHILMQVFSNFCCDSHIEDCNNYLTLCNNATVKSSTGQNNSL